MPDHRPDSDSCLVPDVKNQKQTNRVRVCVMLYIKAVLVKQCFLKIHIPTICQQKRLKLVMYHA